MIESLNYFILFSLSLIISLEILIYHYLWQPVFDTSTLFSSSFNRNNFFLYLFYFSWFLFTKETGSKLNIQFLNKFEIFWISNTFLGHLVSCFPRFYMLIFGKKHSKEQCCQFLKNSNLKSYSMLANKSTSSKLSLNKLNLVVGCAYDWFEGEMPWIIILRYHILQYIFYWF